jgi:hypothetical protein
MKKSTRSNLLAKEGAKRNITMAYSTQSMTRISLDLIESTDNFLIAHLDDDCQHVHHIHTILPLAGLHMPGQTVRESLRELIRRFFRNYDFDQTLRDLVYRVWSNQWPPANGVPH